MKTKQDNFDVEEEFHYTRISWQWNYPFAFIYFIFGGVWNLIAITILVFGGFGSLPFVIIMLLAGLWIIYYAAGQRYNKTEISLSNQGINVKNGPLPWPGNKNVPKEKFLNFTLSEKKCRIRTEPLSPFHYTCLI
jgi:hypothetical protein